MEGFDIDGETFCSTRLKVLFCSACGISSSMTCRKLKMLLKKFCPPLEELADAEKDKDKSKKSSAANGAPIVMLSFANPVMRIL
jgi:hypothetical protein